MYKIINTNKKIFALLTVFFLSLFWIFNTSPTFDPSPAPDLIPETKEATQASPDGLIKLIFKTKVVEPNEISYELFIEEDLKNKNKAINQPIFSETTSDKTNIEIPFNTWSPDNKHFFIKQQNEDHQMFMVFKTSGEEFPNNIFLDVNDYFARKKIPYSLSEVTGWAAPYLLIIRTTKIDDGSEGPSYWLDVSNQNFIQLSTRF